MADDLPALRAAIRAAPLADESALVRKLAAGAAMDDDARERVAAEAGSLIRHLRATARPGLMETFLGEYGLSTEEGVALMCLAEALLRVPDAETADALIRDKIAGADWSRHLGQSSSPLVNASTWALMLTGRVVGGPDDPGWDVAAAAQRILRRAGEPVIRTAVAQAMRLLGRQFVLGTDIADALGNAEAMEAKGYTYSYDMLGEAARTAPDAQRYFLSYAAAIAAIATRCRGNSVRTNPGISVKLSALHPRYEEAQRRRAIDELVPRVVALALHAKNAGMGFNVDAEEADRLDLSLDVIEAALRTPDLAGWDGFGVVVQAYGRRARLVLDWLHALAATLDRRLMVRLVKGAYWDSEIKLAQVLGLGSYPVFTRKAHTDVSYLACARQLLGMTARIYPQFATHNAQTAAAVLELAGTRDDFEFQRLHGMGEGLHEEVRRRRSNRCRIYAPVGVHRDLLAYLVRRLLENGANSSFVNQVLDEDVPVERIAADPVSAASASGFAPAPRIPAPPDLYGPARRNARGWNLADPSTIAALDAAMAPFRAARWKAGAGGTAREIRNPANRADVVGVVNEAGAAEARAALDAVASAAAGWAATPVGARAATLRRAAELYEANAPELMALAVREAGKNRPDAVGEVREAVDFLRYYAAEAEARLGARLPRGPFLCISPWNFPLAIFTGQIAAALVAGNPAIAKPAEQTPLIAARAVSLLHEAGVPHGALRLLPGDGPQLGDVLLRDARVAGMCFTGSTAAAQAINRLAASHLAPDAPLIAETGGLNAMIVDSTALPEQAVRDALASAFQSAGQRCSALRLLCLQEDVAEGMLEMLIGAMAELRLGDPWALATDVGPVIDEEARARIEAHVAAHADRRLARLAPPAADGTFVPPTLIRLGRIEELREEIFGPVLHVVTFRAEELDAVVDRINALGYGLTLAVHSRVEERVRQVTARARIGNVYVNRNQIGAVVGVQPFGGEGLSGTGPKAGGPLYLDRFTRPPPVTREALLATVEALEARAGDLPGPVGESDRLSLHPRGRVLCLGGLEAGVDQLAHQLAVANATGNDAVTLPAGADPLAAAADPAVALVAAAGDEATLRRLREALARREGPIVALAAGVPDPVQFVIERTLSIDVTAAGGNVALLAASA